MKNRDQDKLYYENERLQLELSQLKAELAQAKGDLKNFHRIICEAAGYHHDETNWVRDQLSLANAVKSKGDS